MVDEIFFNKLCQNTKAGLIFVMIMSFSVFLACTSEVAGKSFYIIANYITMKISPFEKAIVSNIKDLILVVISVEWFYDFKI